MQKSTKFKIGASLTIVYFKRLSCYDGGEAHGPAVSNVKIDIVTPTCSNVT